jgi:hypothetical protein
MLKPEQIAEFNARAEAGERPVMEWETIGGYPEMRVKWIRPCGRLGVGQRGTEWIIFDIAQNAREDCPFASPAAAQLAAEHLLREATAPLHADIEAIRDAVVNGRLQLSEIDIDWQTINAVLAIIDDHTPPKEGV